MVRSSDLVYRVSCSPGNQEGPLLLAGKPSSKSRRAHRQVELSPLRDGTCEPPAPAAHSRSEGNLGSVSSERKANREATMRVLRKRPGVDPIRAASEDDLVISVPSRS